MTEHTPLPWEVRPYVAGGWPIHAKQGPVTVCPAIAHGEADASFIVKACNMHDELLRALIGATHALYSYQHGNASTELAKDQAEFCASIIAKAREATP
jgi:hypothetical protein